MDSLFNTKTSNPVFQEGSFVETGRSERFVYYKTRRYGIVHFVKTRSEEYSNDLITSEALKKEFLLGYGLNHPGIVRYYTLEDNKLYEEFIEGETLGELIEGNDPRLYEKDFIKNISRQILEAVGYMHANGIVHLDLKPENVMVTRLGNQIKIVDLSCAQSISDNATAGFTECYAAPEQISGNVNVGTDIYQVGKIIEELTTAANCREKWKKYIEKSTANHPDNRFKSAQEALKGIPPEKNHIRRLGISAFLITCLAIGLLNILSRETDKSKVEHLENYDGAREIQSETNTIDLEEEQESSAPPTSTPAPSVTTQEIQEIKTERVLTKLIIQKLEEIYSEEVTPMYERMLKDKNYKKEVDSHQGFVNAYMAAFEQLQQYGEELKSQYPGYEVFIDERIERSFETKTYKMREKLYPRINTP